MSEDADWGVVGEQPNVSEWDQGKKKKNHWILLLVAAGSSFKKHKQRYRLTTLTQGQRLCRLMIFRIECAAANRTAVSDPAGSLSQMCDGVRFLISSRYLSAVLDTLHPSRPTAPPPPPAPPAVLLLHWPPDCESTPETRCYFYLLLSRANETSPALLHRPLQRLYGSRHHFFFFFFMRRLWIPNAFFVIFHLRLSLPARHYWIKD